MFPGEERKAVSLGGDCLTSSRRKTTSHDKKMFFKTWHRNRVLFILNAFSSLANIACGGKEAGVSARARGAESGGLGSISGSAGLPVRLR